MKTQFNSYKLVKDYVTKYFQFVCTPAEFVTWYGMPKTELELKIANRYAVICRDGMIRPRSKSELV